MTEQEKDILIGKMLDSPSSLTDEDLSMILSEEELKEIYELSSVVKGACIRQPEIDVAMEWRLFRHRILPKPSPIRWVMKVAAIFLGVALASGIIVKFIDHIFTQNDSPVVAEAGKPLDKINQLNGNCAGNHPYVNNKSISDTYPEAENKASVIVSYTSKTPKLTSDKVEVEEEDIDVDEYLRRQQAEISYEIALLNAEIYLDERDAIREFMGYLNEDDMSEEDVDIVI